MALLQTYISVVIIYASVHLYCGDVSALKCHNVTNTTLLCQNYIPKHLPEGTANVEIVDIIPKTTIISNTSFAGNGWSQVKRLKVSTVDTYMPWLTLYNNTFINLHSLEYLCFYVPAQMDIKAGAFKGLGKLTELDLLEMKRTSMIYFVRMLDNKDAMPDLKVIRINKMNIMMKPPNRSTSLDSKFFKAMAMRNISEFHITHTDIATLDYKASLVMCDRLTYFDGTDSHISKYNSTRDECKSLETVILSGLRRQSIPKFLRFKDVVYNASIFSGLIFFKNVKVLNLDRLFTRSSSIQNCTFNVQSDLVFQLRDLSLQSNVLQHFDVVINTKLLTNLEKLEVQHNLMQYFNGDTFKSIPLLKMLNASGNQFGMMQKKNTTDFEKLLRHLKHLQILDFSNNGLTFIPANTFKCNTELQQIYISNNKLEQIALTSSFSMSLVDLRNNKISYFNENSRLWFDELFVVHRNSSTFNADVTGNPFQCVCEHQTFLQWFVQTPFIKNFSQKLTCTFHGQKQITQLLNEELKEACERPIIIRNIAIASALGLAIILIIATYTVFAKRRRRKRLERQRTLEETIAQIQNGTYRFEFPVFLSYSNVDAETVMRFIYPVLVDHLRRIFDIPRDLVCIGDLHFRPGHGIYDEISRCLENSAVVIYVVSNEFCQSTYCRHELEQAYGMEKPVLLLFLEDVEEDEMTPLLRELFRKYARIKACHVDGQMHIVPKWEDICSSILDLLPQ